MGVLQIWQTLLVDERGRKALASHEVPVPTGTQTPTFVDFGRQLYVALSAAGLEMPPG
jgi:hypothetical protein